MLFCFQIILISTHREQRNWLIAQIPPQDVRHEAMVFPTSELSSALYSDEFEVIMEDAQRSCDYWIKC